MDSYSYHDLSSARLLNEKMSSGAGSVTVSEEDKASTSIPLEPLSSPIQPLPQPPSRWVAWAQIVAGHLVVFDTFGYIGSWGLFEAYYVESMNRPFSDISWVGSMQIFLVFFIGAFSGRALDAGYLRLTLLVGCALQILAIFSASWARNYWELFLTQGVCQGIGNGLVFCPMISLVSTYYTDRWRALAVAFVAAGGATGGMVFPAIAKQLLASLGVAWTLRVMGFVFVANSTITLALVRVRVQPRKQGPLIEWAAFREWPFLLYTVGTFLTLWGVYFAYYYVRLLPLSIIVVR